ncbi:hypothetical protein [Cloacibacillus porcorum]
MKNEKIFMNGKEIAAMAEEFYTAKSGLSVAYLIDAEQYDAAAEYHNERGTLLRLDLTLKNLGEGQVALRVDIQKPTLKTVLENMLNDTFSVIAENDMHEVSRDKALALAEREEFASLFAAHTTENTDLPFLLLNIRADEADIKRLINEAA